MGMIGAIRADRLINQVVGSGDLESSTSVHAISKLKSLASTAIPKLIRLLSTTRHEETELIVRLLTRLVSTQTMEYYFEGLADSDNRVVAGVVRALKKAHNVDPNKFLDLFDNPNTSKPAILEILSSRQEVLSAETLVRYGYKLQNNDLVMLYRIIDSLADESLVPELINRIDAKDPIMRAQIAKVLARFSSKPSRDALHQLLDDDDKTVRLAALEALSQMDGELDMQQLCQLLKDPDMKIQSKAIDAIVKLNHSNTVNYLLDPLQDESEYARRAAVEILNEIADQSSIKELLLAIKDRDWWVRSRAADALGRIGGKKVVDSVIELIKDEDEFVRRTAIEVINATKDESTYDILVEALSDSDWWVRERAIDGLAALGNIKAVPVLIKLLEKDQSNSDIAVIIIKALVKLNSTEAILPILERLHHGTDAVKKEALQALSELTDEANATRVKREIAKATEAAGEELKQIAANVLLRINSSYSTKTGMSAIEPMENLSMGADSPGAVNLPDTISRGSISLVTEIVDISKLQPDDILGNRYRFIRLVGKGAFGSVLLVEDLIISEEIILKFLNPNVASDHNIIKRFVYELRFARKITHPNVIRIFDMLTFGESFAIAMEYFPSHTLTSEIYPGQPMQLARAIKIMGKVCAGMVSAHHANVVHRDLKPSNILINNEDIIKIVDFGVSSAISQMDTKLTKTGLLIGTPTYMAPEQVLRRQVDARTDIYSLGIIMYEMLTGIPPYSGGDSMSIMFQHVQGQAVPPRDLNQALPQTLNAIIMKAMASAPEKRYQSMDELHERLSTYSE